MLYRQTAAGHCRDRGGKRVSGNPALNSEAGGHDLEGEGTGGTTSLKS